MNLACFVVVVFFFADMHQNIRSEQQMVQVIFSICVNPIRIMPMADGYVPTCRANPILISSFEDR